MTTAPVLRSAALQKALGQLQLPSPRLAGGPSFATTLASARTPAPKTPRVASAKPNLPLTPVSQPLQAGGPVPFQNLIASAASKYGLDPALLAAVVKQE